METNKELESKLVEIISSISDSVGQVKDFAVEQLPDIAQQYILFGMAWEAIAFIFLCLFLTFSIKLLIWGFKNKETHDAGIFAIQFGGFTSFLFLLLCVVQIKQVLLVFLAPKLYLIQGLANLVK